MQITSILPSARREGRFEIIVDGAALATHSIDAVERLGLATGTAIDSRIETAIRHEASVLATYDRALALLALRSRSSQELGRHLARKGEPPELIAAALERLRQAGFLDDAGFARQFTRSKALGAGMSQRRLRMELGRRGVAGETAREAIDEVFSEEQISDEQSIERVARKKINTLTKLDPATRRRRLYGFLARRGFDSADIARVVRMLVQPADIEGANDD
jgi:regulatory protein